MHDEYFTEQDEAWEERGCTRRCWMVFHHTGGEHKTNCPLRHATSTLRKYSWDSLPDLQEDITYMVEELLPNYDSSTFKGTIRVNVEYVPSEEEIT